MVFGTYGLTHSRMHVYASVIKHRYTHALGHQVHECHVFGEFMEIL